MDNDPEEKSVYFVGPETPDLLKAHLDRYLVVVVKVPRLDHIACTPQCVDHCTSVAVDNPGGIVGLAKSYPCQAAEIVVALPAVEEWLGNHCPCVCSG